MLKPLLFILTIVTLLALALNFNWFNDEEKNTKTATQAKENIQIKPRPNEIITSMTINEPVIVASNLHAEIKKLLKKAQELFKQDKDSEALALYDSIIEKSKDSNEEKVLKLFAQACFEKATIHYIYPLYDSDTAIEMYELVIQKFEKSNKKALLLLYMEAKTQQASFSSKEEMVIAYDEVIEKFNNDKEKRFEKEIEELLFVKSFALMGRDDEEAIEVLDSIIAKYDDKSNLPNTVRFSILNNIELSIITNNDASRYVDLAEEYMSDSPDTKPLIGMLNIIKNAQDLDQKEALALWIEKHGEYKFPEWDFSELRKWVNSMETPEAQARISAYLDLFEKQKYQNTYQPSTTIKPSLQEYSDKHTQNEVSQTPEASEEEESENRDEVIITTENNPYINELLAAQPEQVYPNTTNYNPNAETAGATHTYTSDDY